MNDPVMQVQYVFPDGTLNPAGYELLRAMIAYIRELEARIEALEP